MAAEQQDGRAATGSAVLRRRVTDAITEAAFAELAETGYARMSMEAVARRAGVGKAALYRRWPSKQAMVTELIRTKVTDELPPAPATGTLHTDLRKLLATYRSQLGHPLVARIATGLLAEVGHDSVLEQELYAAVAVPRRAAARAILQSAIDRDELPSELDLELCADLLLAPLAFRMLVTHGHSDDEYLEALTNATEAALKAAIR